MTPWLSIFSFQSHTITCDKGTNSISVAKKFRDIKITVQLEGSTLRYEVTVLASKCMPILFHSYLLLSSVLKMRVPWIHQFPIASVTNDHKLRGLEQCKFVILESRRSETPNQFSWTKIKVLAELVASGGSERKICFTAFFSFQRLPVFPGFYPLLTSHQSFASVLTYFMTGLNRPAPLL